MSITSATYHARSPGPRAKLRAASPPAQIAHTLKLEPQPQVDLTFGLLNLKPAPCRPST